MNRLISAALLVTFALPAAATEFGQGHRSPYAGEVTRAIKSLSDDDLAELRRGGGWGLARAAELNGMPGPAHLLELKDEIPLTADQVTAIEAAYEGMRGKAVAEGERLIAAERRLDEAFRDATVTEESLAALLAEIEASRTALRFIHLSTHLRMPALLSGEQIARYNALRGYTAADPCAAVPEGHDPAMWRRHYGCN